MDQATPAATTVPAVEPRDTTFRKQVTLPRGKYSPVAAVKAHGDTWALWVHGPSAATALALRERTSDMDELFAMTLMEKGVVGRSGL